MNRGNIVLLVVIFASVIAGILIEKKHEATKQPIIIHDTLYITDKNLCAKYYYDGVMSPVDITMQSIDSFFELQWNQDSITQNKIHGK